jgi:hypothetical protein
MWMTAAMRPGEATEVAQAPVAEADPFSCLIASGELTPDALTRARRLATEAGERLAATLTRLGHVSERDMAQGFAQAYRLRLVEAASLGAFRCRHHRRRFCGGRSGLWCWCHCISWSRGTLGDDPGVNRGAIVSGGALA